MRALMLALLGAGLGPAEGPATAPAAAEANERRPFRAALLATEGLDAEALDAALRLRLPELELHRSWDLEREGDAVAKPYVFIHLAPASEGAGLSLELITDEGQAYVRALDDEGPRERIAASFVVSILSAIELREVQADRVEVQAPQRAEAETISEAVDAAKGAALLTLPHGFFAELGVTADVFARRAAEAPETVAAARAELARYAGRFLLPALAELTALDAALAPADARILRALCEPYVARYEKFAAEA